MAARGVALRVTPGAQIPRAHGVLRREFETVSIPHHQHRSLSPWGLWVVRGASSRLCGGRAPSTPSEVQDVLSPCPPRGCGSVWISAVLQLELYFCDAW